MTFAPPAGHPVKQADTVMLGYPLGLPMSVEIRRNDLEAYEPVTDPQGPAMTWVRHSLCCMVSAKLMLSFTLLLLFSSLKSMFAIGWLELGEAEKAQHLLEKCFKNIQGPFQVFFSLTHTHIIPTNASLLNTE